MGRKTPVLYRRSRYGLFARGRMRQTRLICIESVRGKHDSLASEQYEANNTPLATKITRQIGSIRHRNRARQARLRWQRSKTLKHMHDNPAWPSPVCQSSSRKGPMQHGSPLSISKPQGSPTPISLLQKKFPNI